MKLTEEMLKKIIELRQTFHAYPEVGFQEFETQKRLQDFLIDVIGIPSSSIRKMAGTGLVIDVNGSKPAADGAIIRRIALRADMDALPMTEGNADLAYRSKNAGKAHMCGHDGHMASLVGAIAAFWAARGEFACNQWVRFF